MEGKEAPTHLPSFGPWALIGSRENIGREFVLWLGSLLNIITVISAVFPQICEGKGAVTS